MNVGDLSFKPLRSFHRRAIKGRASKGRKPLAPGGDGDLRVGILGMGHLGKQLLLALLEKTHIKPSHIKISTRRPELAGKHKKRKILAVNLSSSKAMSGF